MCIYCEKGQRIKTNDYGGVSYIYWDDCVPKLHISIDAVLRMVLHIDISIAYCPFCGRDLISDQKANQALKVEF